MKELVWLLLLAPACSQMTESPPSAPPSTVAVVQEQGCFSQSDCSGQEMCVDPRYPVCGAQPTCEGMTQCGCECVTACTATSCEAEFDILYGEGISKEGDLLDLGVELKVIEKSGAWYAFDGERMGQGRENARQFLKDNADVRTEIDSRLRKGMGLPVVEREAPKHDKADVVPMPEKKKA